MKLREKRVNQFTQLREDLADGIASYNDIFNLWEYIDRIRYVQNTLYDHHPFDLDFQILFENQQYAKDIVEKLLTRIPHA